MRIGYLRVSTREQCEDRQYDELAAICDELYLEKLSALASKRPVYESVVARLQPGDSFVIPSGQTHGCVCLVPGTLVDSFTPRRDDFL